MPVINMRVDDETLALIDRAAKAAGLTRSAFMLSTAKQRAQDALLDQSVFVVSKKDFARLQKMLDEPAEPNENLKRLMRRKPLWD